MSDGALEFDAFFEGYHTRLYTALCLTTGHPEEADEIAQDAFLKVLERWDRVSRMEDPAAFLFTTAMNLFRKRYRRSLLLSRQPVTPDVADDAYTTIDDRDQLVRAMRDLSPQQSAI